MESRLSTEILPRMGEMVIATKIRSPLPLEKTVYEGQILGPIASLSVTQHFINPLDEPAELEYLFPLSHTAAIVDFKLTVGARTIRADLMELKKAQMEYEQALQEGRRAGLMEQRRPNLFAVRLANVRQGENLQASIRYQERLGYDGGEYKLVIPMGITPRYHTPDYPEEGIGLDAPIAGSEEPIGGLEISLSVDAGLPAGRPVCGTHPIEITRLDERRFNLHLAGSQIPDHDFVLRYPVVKERFGVAAWRSSGEEGDYFLATLLPPAWSDMVETLAREVIFVLDRSGSMMGEPIRQAVNALRACLRTLTPSDRFRLLLFDTETEWYRNEPSPLIQEAVEQADQFLSQVKGSGGTEIVRALTEALSPPIDPQRPRLVILLTDGAVSAEDRAYREVNHLLGSARLFTIGIGPSVNRAFLEKLAQAGRGTAEFIGLGDDIEGAIMRFQDRISFPALTNLEITADQNAIWDVYPSPLRDLFYDQPLEIVGRIVNGNTSRQLSFQGSRGSEKVELEVELPPTSQHEPAIARLWARACLDELIAQESIGVKGINRDTIINLALKHRLVTPYTAFFARDDEVIGVEGGKPRLIEVSQPLPPGLKIEGFFGNWLVGSSGFMESEETYKNAQYLEKPFVTGKFDLAMPASQDYRDITAVTKSEMPSQEELTLRWLARSQRVNGSWNDDAEMTAAALLAFVRAGHNTSSGDYRRQVGRAVEWLRATPVSGFAAFLRALALHELAEVTRWEPHRQVAEEAIRGLPPATSLLQSAITELLSGKLGSYPAPATIQSIDDLRWAMLFPGAGFVGIEKFYQESSSDLERTLAAAVA